jgi:hypothetical protein
MNTEQKEVSVQHAKVRGPGLCGVWTSENAVQAKFAEILF